MNTLRKSEDLLNNKSKFVYISDDNYILPTIISITSLFANKRKSSYYEVYVIINNISQENMQLLENLKKEFVDINIINGESYVRSYENIKQQRHVTTSALIKFFLPQILKNEDKILFIDGDTIIQQDLTELFHTDVTDVFAGVVKDTFTITSMDYIQKNNINCKNYFNSGVMLLNLAKLRIENISKKLIEDKQKFQTMFMDQDTFNKIFNENVLFLSYRYNFLNYYLDISTSKELSKFFNECLPSKERDLYESCYILHFGGVNKPWKQEMGILSNIYKRYYNVSILKNKKLKLKKVFLFRKIIEKLFSIKNQTGENIKYKVITVLGIKVKIKKRDKNGK